MAILQQQRQQQQGVVGGGSGSSKLSPSLGGAPKQPLADSMPHPGMGGPLSDLHAKTQGMYSGKLLRFGLRYYLSDTSQSNLSV